MPDRPQRRSIVPLALLTATLALGALSPTPAPAGDEPALREWIRGPVRYLARADEAKAFRGLESDDERALFIERFWGRRDPSPETLTNEYRQIFWERVNQANSQFIDSPKPGWMTDRGKVFILYGAPSEIRDYPNLDTKSTATSGRGLLRWFYDGRPGARADLNPTVVVPFVRQAGGEYQLSYDPKLSSIFFDEVAIREGRDTDLARLSEMIGTPTRSELSVMLDLGRMQEVPTQAQVIMERVETAESYRTIPLASSIVRYRPTANGEGLVVLTVDLDWVGEDLSPTTIARFTPRSATRRVRVLGEDSFYAVDGPEGRIAEGRVRLAPGEWDLTLIVIDPVTAKTGMLRRALSVPEPGGALALSDATWVASLESLEYASLSSYDEPFHVGPFRVVPRLRPRLAIGSPLTLFYEIYGGEAPYRISYRLFGEESAGHWVALGEPRTLSSSVAGQGWELATSERWPAGGYRIEFEVTDEAGASASGALETELVPADQLDAPPAVEGAPTVVTDLDG